MNSYKSEKKNDEILTLNLNSYINMKNNEITTLNSNFHINKKKWLNIKFKFESLHKKKKYWSIDI